MQAQAKGKYADIEVNSTGAPVEETPTFDVLVEPQVENLAIKLEQCK